MSSDEVQVPEAASGYARMDWRADMLRLTCQPALGEVVVLPWHLLPETSKVYWRQVLLRGWIDNLNPNLPEHVRMVSDALLRADRARIRVAQRARGS